MNENKLTAEERIEPFFESNAVSFKGEYYVDKAAFYACMEEFADQQTAEQEARIKELEGVLRMLDVVNVSPEFYDIVQRVLNKKQ